MPPGILKSSQPIGDDPKLCIYTYIFLTYSCPLLIYNKPNKRIYWTSDKSSPSRSHGMSPGILVFTQKMSGKWIFVLRNMVYWLVVWNIFFHILGMSSSQLTSIFFRGVETTNQYKHVSGRVAGVLLFRSVENCLFFATASARADGLSLLLGNTTLLPCSRRAHFFFAIQWIVMFHICQIYMGLVYQCYSAGVPSWYQKK